MANVDQMLDGMSAQMLVEWVAFYELEREATENATRAARADSTNMRRQRIR